MNQKTLPAMIAIAATCLGLLCGQARAQDESVSPPHATIPDGPYPDNQATTPDESMPHQEPVQEETQAESPVMNLLVISAVFGAGTDYADVTNRVNYLLWEADGGFCVNPDSLKTDPISGTRKSLVITYEFRGRRHVCAIDETCQASLDILRSWARKQK